MKIHHEVLHQTLRALATQETLSTEDLNFLAQCLHSKWNGIQVVAAKVLAKLHPPEALPLLKEWLMRHIANRNDRGIYLAQKALLPCLTESDVAWVFDLYLTHPYQYQYFLIGALVRFPNSPVMQLVINECYKPYNLEAVTVLARALIKDRDQVLQALLSNPNVSRKAYLEQAFGWGPLSKDQLLKFKRPL